MQNVIPDEIALHESMTHALFYPDDIHKTTFWVKQRALRPPSKAPNEVSFNRACYIPDDEQKKLAKKIQRTAKFRCFLRITPQDLKNAVIEIKKIQNFEDDAYFTYTPIYDINVPSDWPDKIPKRWGTGFNPVHVDLYYTRSYEKGEANSFILSLSKMITREKDGFCETLCESKEQSESEKWHGEKLCKAS